MPQTELTDVSTPAEAFWNQRHILKARQHRFRLMQEAINWKGDLSLPQWAQLYSFCLDFQPDLILELGRGRGNSTCVFTEVAQALDKTPRVLSLCLSPDWHSRSEKQIKKLCGGEWADPLEALETDVLTFDYRTALDQAERVFVFWDAHGFEIAEKVLGEIVPLIHNKAHVVAMHDLGDARYLDDEYRKYGDRGLWMGSNAETPRVRLGVVDSTVAQSVAVTDFTIRNGISLESADHSFHTELEGEREGELEQLLEPDFMSKSAHWFWFRLDPELGPFTFPHARPPKAVPPTPPPPRPYL